MGREGIEANHERALEPGSKVLALEGNPVFDQIATVANALSERLLCVNAVLVEGQRIAWSAGRWRGALDQVLDEARLAFVREVDGPVDVLVASVSGPLARTLYQAEKGVKNSEAVVKDGGAVVLHAACPAGLGQDRYLSLLAAAKTHEAALAKVEDEGYVLGDHKAVKVRALEARGVEWHLACPGVAAYPEAARKVRDAGLALHSSLEEAVRAACRG
jgi:nickel-dependent lactate racemase